MSLQLCATPPLSLVYTCLPPGFSRLGRGSPSKCLVRISTIHSLPVTSLSVLQGSVDSLAPQVLRAHCCERIFLSHSRCELLLPEFWNHSTFFFSDFQFLVWELALGWGFSLFIVCVLMTILFRHFKCQFWKFRQTTTTVHMYLVSNV